MATPQPATKAPAPAPSRILRIGIIQNGRIIEERLLRARHNISIGQAARNTFIIPSASLPRAYQIFEVDGETYTIKFTDFMDGRISVGGKVQTFLQVKQLGLAQKKGDLWHLRLEPNARGKVVLGDVTILYQFVTAPPMRPKARLPASIRGSLTLGMDWFFSMVFIGSAGLHLLLAIIFLVMDKPKHISGSRFKAMAQQVVFKRQEQFKKRNVESGKDGMGEEGVGMEADAGDAREADTRKSSGRGKSRARDDGGERKGPRIARETEDAVVSALTGQAIVGDSAAAGFASVAIGAACKGADCKGARSGADLLGQGMVGADLNKSATTFGAASGTGGGGGPGGTSRGRGRGFKGGRGVGRGISGPGRDAETRAVTITRKAGPRPRIGASIPTVRNVPQSLAEKIKRSLRSKAMRLKYLYNQKLQAGAKFKCRTKIGFMLNSSGRVSSVTVSGGCPGDFISGVKSRVSSWRLPPGATQYIHFTISFSY